MSNFRPTVKEAEVTFTVTFQGRIKGTTVEEIRERLDNVTLQDAWDGLDTMEWTVDPMGFKKSVDDVYDAEPDDDEEDPPE